jgi:3-oxoacyl-[acyl-carrier protein] reductase
MRFEGKVAVITGAGAGIGRGYAAGFACEGAAVVVVDVDDEGADQTVRLVQSEGGRAVAVHADVTDDTAVADMVATAVSTFGGIDILVNNAARHLGRTHECLGIPADEWRLVLDVNVVGPLVCAQACRAAMVARGGGVVVNQSSVAAWVASGGAYGVSKLALNRLTMALAQELAVDAIRVVGIAPGVIGSEAVLAAMSPADVTRLKGEQLIPRTGRIEDCVQLALFLCSTEASFITGHTMAVDGGYVPRP